MEATAVRQILSGKLADENIADEIIEWIDNSSRVRERLNEDILRIAIKQFESDVLHRKHVCGSAGFGGEITDYCTPCTWGGALRREGDIPEVALFKAGLEQLLFGRDLGVYALTVTATLREDKVFNLRKRYGLN